MSFMLPRHWQDLKRQMAEERRFSEGKQFHEAINLRTMVKIARYSFIAHRSVNHLDLSLKEFSSLSEERKVIVRLLFCSADPAYSKKFVNTAEGCRKTEKLERRWLYTLHLDLPKGREEDIISLVTHGHCDTKKTLCFNQINVSDSIYSNSLRSFIKEALKQNGFKMNFVRRQMALMKNVLCRKMFEFHSLEDQILNYLYKSCTDSDIVIEFLPLLDFNSWLRMNPPLEVFEYLLHHAYRRRYDLQLNDSQGTLLNECFFDSRFKYIKLFLRYQNAPYYDDCNSSVLVSTWMRDTPGDWYPEELEIPYSKGLMSKRRFSLWLQVFHAYTVRNNPPWYNKIHGTLRLVWRSIPDSFFTLEELERAYASVGGRLRDVRKVHRFYTLSMAGDLISGMPRPLLHYCRTAIRKSLCYNFQLPHGIEELPLPPKLQAFLRLENLPEPPKLKASRLKRN